MTKRWPDLFIVGAPKAGTSSLYELLQRSGDICMASVKEPRFFNVNIDHDAFMSGSVTNEERYLALFDSCPGAKLRGEASPSYLVDPDTPAAIYARSPEAKIIVMVRDPVDRAYSHFRFHEIRTGRTTRSFDEAIEECLAIVGREFYHPRYLLQPGFYSAQIQRYQETFGVDRVRTVLYNDFVSSTESVVAELCEFLQVSLPADLVLTGAQRNAAGAPRNGAARWLMANEVIRTAITRFGLGSKAVEMGKRHLLKASTAPPMSASAREVLEELYAADTRALAELLGRELPWGSNRSAKVD